MRIFVAGGSGFIGKHFLLKENPKWKYYATYDTSKDFSTFLKNNSLKNVVPIHTDLKSEKTIKDICKKHGNEFDVCLYVMGNSDIKKSREDPEFDLNANITPLVKLLNLVKFDKFIFMSSGAVYEGHKGLINPSYTTNPTVPYAISKLASERYICNFQKNTNQINEYLILRFFGAYGPMEPSRKIYTNLVKSFAIQKHNTYTMFGDGKNYIDAMYIDDTINALYSMISSNKGNKILDLCVGKPLTINELIIKAGAIFGKNVRIEHKGNSPEYTTFYGCSDEIESLFGFKPTIQLSVGLRKLARYIKECK